MPVDPPQLRLAMLAVVDGGDALARTVARAAARLDAVRGRAQTRDLQRLAAKPGVDRATLVTLHTRAQAVRQQAEVSEALAARSFIEPVRMDPAVAVSTVHGRVVAGNRLGRADLRVRALAADGTVLAESPTDARGYYRLDVPGGANGAPPSAVKIVVLRAGAVVHQDPSGFDVRLGRSRFREIVVG